MKELNAKVQETSTWQPAKDWATEIHYTNLLIFSQGLTSQVHWHSRRFPAVTFPLKYISSACPLQCSFHIETGSHCTDHDPNNTDHVRGCLLHGMQSHCTADTFL